MLQKQALQACFSLNNLYIIYIYIYIYIYTYIYIIKKSAPQMNRVQLQYQILDISNQKSKNAS